MSFSLTGNKLLVLDGAIESLRTFETEHVPAQIIYHGDFTYDENEKLTAKLNVKLTGAVNPYFSLSLDTAYAKRYGSGVQDVNLIKLGPDESIFDLEMVKREAFEQYGDYIFMNIPTSRSGKSSWGFSYIESGRQTPIKLKELIHEQYHYMIKLPDSLELISSNVDINIDNAIGKLKISLRQEGNTVYSTREIEFKKDLVLFSEFADFSELWEAWMNPHFQEIIIKK